VLIEKSKTLVTDAKGNYKIVDLRPGTYLLTFTLDGAVMAYHNEAMIQEAVYQTAGGTAETIVAGINMNLVPKDAATASPARSSTASRLRAGRAIT
jgi:hypothetical protein